MSEFEATVAEILKQTKLTRDQVLKMIAAKHWQLGSVTLEGAAGMVAKELGVEVDG